jgi:hypothetical protein
MNLAEQVQALYDAWEKRTLRKGVKRGVKRGLKLGVKRGEIASRKMLVALLMERFGSLPSGVSDRIERAKLAKLERWGSRVATATSLDDVLGRQDRTSLAERVQARYDAWEKRALRKGVKRDIKRGEILSRKILVAILTLRFGSLPDSVSERIEQADLATLERWGSRGATATSLDDVFA